MTMDRFYGGIDSGSWNTKVVLIDGEARLRSSAIVRTGADIETSAAECFDKAIERAETDRSNVISVWSTGFGRHSIDFAEDRRTELDCHARGVAHYMDGPLTIVDIGGQDAKVIHLDGEGRRLSHKMNRKCAAGTGSFLEEIALRLGVDIENLSDLAARHEEELELGSFCTVFTSTEVLALIRQGKKPPDLARAAYRSLIKRVTEMAVLEGLVVATGGVIAHHPVALEMMESMADCRVVVPEHPQEMGAFGAALAARNACSRVSK